MGEDEEPPVAFSDVLLPVLLELPLRHPIDPSECSRKAAFFSPSLQEKAETPLPTLGNEILPSITRKVILQLAEQMGLTITQKTLSPENAMHANELFIAVTTKDIVGVVKFDDAQIADGKVGPYTKKLIEAFKQKVTS